MNRRALGHVVLMGMLAVVSARSQATELGAEADCTIESTPSPVRLSAPDLAAGASVAPDSRLSLLVGNRDARAGVVAIRGTVFSQHAVEFRDLGVVNVGPDAWVAVSIPVAALGLPTGSLDFSGHLSLMATAEYPDGSRASLDAPLSLYFHPTAGGWLLYDGRTKREVFHDGALSAEAQRQRAEASRTGEGTGAAYVESVSDGTDWRPLEDDSTNPRAEATADGEGSESDSLAPSVKFCIRQMSTYSDAGVGEDFWQNNFATPRWSRGSYVTITRNFTTVFSGYLGDGLGIGDPGSGCTPDMSGGWAFYGITIQSRGRVQGNDVRVVDDGVGTIRSVRARFIARSGTYEITLNAAGVHDEFNVYMAGAYALYRHAGGMSSETYRYRMNFPSGSQYSRTEDTIYIDDGHTFNKFVIVHEAGHAIGDFGTGNNDHKLVGTNCSGYSSTSCPASRGSHSMGSKEYSRCALGEGFAHFYAADVFNSHGETDCKFEYYKNEFGGDSTPLVNCEVSNGDFDVRYMERNCHVPYDGYGTELDWLRTLWDVHTDGSSPPGFTQILRWMDDADAWGDQTAYDELDDEANTVGGTLNSNWDTAKQRNGVDW